MARDGSEDATSQDEDPEVVLAKAHADMRMRRRAARRVGAVWVALSLAVFLGAWAYFGYPIPQLSKSSPGAETWAFVKVGSIYIVFTLLTFLPARIWQNKAYQEAGLDGA